MVQVNYVFKNYHFPITYVLVTTTSFKVFIILYYLSEFPIFHSRFTFILLIITIRPMIVLIIVFVFVITIIYHFLLIAILA